MYYVFYDPIAEEYIQVCFDASNKVTHWTDWCDTIPCDIYPIQHHTSESLSDWEFPIIAISPTLITPNSHPELFI